MSGSVCTTAQVYLPLISRHSCDAICTHKSTLYIGEPEVLVDSFVLNIDLVQTGVGGTDSWSQRARPYDEYRLMAKNYSYDFWMIPVRSLDDSVEAGRKYCTKSF